MDLSEMQTRAAELEQQIATLPAGSVTKKTVNGKEYFYHRWTENKKRLEVSAEYFVKLGKNTSHLLLRGFDL